MPSITTIDERITDLGSIRILGQSDPEQGYTPKTLWEIEGYVPQVPPKGIAVDGSPDSYGIRTLLLGAQPRYIWYDAKTSGGNISMSRFNDPLLLDSLVSCQDKDGNPFALKVFGVKAKAKLVGEARVQLTPVSEYPDDRTPGFRRKNPKEKPISVPVFLLHGAPLVLDAKSFTPTSCLPALNTDHSIELAPEGVLFTANIPPPDGDKAIPTRVRLEQSAGKASVVFVNPQPAPSQRAWRQVWRNLNRIAESTRDTAWARLWFEIEGDLPALKWSAVKSGGVIDVKDWGNFKLPEGIAQVTLADQPLESRLLAPLQVLHLTRPVSFKRQGAKLTVSADLKDSAAAVGLDYTWTGPESESLDFGKVPLVHDAATVRGRLLAIEGRDEQDAGDAVGFMKLDDGWTEIPFGPPHENLPKPIEPRNAQDAKGSFWIGSRRHEFHDGSSPPTAAPWSVQLAEPEDFSVIFKFDGEKLQEARVCLARFAMSVRGMAWLAATAPNEHDALPLASDDPDAWFDVLLRKCDGAAQAAPFVLDALSIQAPCLPGGDGGWAVAKGRQAMQPILSTSLALSVRTAVTAPLSRAGQRVWLRHPSLPSVQLMGTTRSDPVSDRPHASRALTPFDRASGVFVLEGPASLAPKLSAATRAAFFATGITGIGDKDLPQGVHLVPLAALTLPGVELEPVTPDDARTKGAYTLPMWDDPHARAMVPPPEDEDDKKKGPVAVVTAHDRVGMQKLILDNLLLRANAGTLNSEMFPAAKPGTAVTVKSANLYPPLVWEVDVKIDAAIELAGIAVAYGKALFKSRGWTWDASGNKLLEGPSARLSVSDAGCALGEAGEAGVAGWSVEERALDTRFMHDGRGVAWARDLYQTGALIGRQMQSADKPGSPFWLASTRQPIAVGGLKDIAWQFSFTDVPIDHGTRSMTVPEGLASGAGKAWTWSLSQPRPDGDLAIEPLKLGPCLRFVPTALEELTCAELGEAVAKAVIQGTLVLGTDNRVAAGDTLRRVRMTVKDAGDGTLAISDITGFASEGEIAWDLDLESVGGVFSGAPQLKGVLKLDEGQLKLKGASISAHLFTSDVTVGPKDIDLFASEMPFGGGKDPDPRKVVVTDVTVDLQRAQLSLVTMKAALREGVICTIVHKRTGDAFETTGTVDWFGNSLAWDVLEIDAARRSCVFSKPKVKKDITVFAGQPGASIKNGVVCFGIVPDNANGMAVQACFAELSMDKQDLQLTHLLREREGAAEDLLRFDGIWRQPSLIEWPDLRNIDFDPVGDGAQVQFTGTDPIAQETDFVLSDHCLDGARIQKAANGAGICLSQAGASQASSWLVEMVQRFTPASGSPVQVRCMGMLQLWRPHSLASELKATWEAREKEAGLGKGKSMEGFGFVPSYIGRTPTLQFLRQGVRRNDHGHAGLLDKRMATALTQEPEDAWILLAGVTALCRDGLADASNTDKARYLMLHVPVVSAIGAQAHLQALLKVSSATIHMSRHDITATRILTDAPSAIPPGELVRIPLARDIPFLRDLLPTDALGGAALSANWFVKDAQAIVPAWHVEQLQRPGKTLGVGTISPPLPFPYPRAALMLGALMQAWKDGETFGRETLSILARIGKRTGIDESAQAMNVDVRAIRLQFDRPGRHPKANAADPVSLRGDLIVGGPAGVAVVPLSASDWAVEDPKHFIALAIGRVAAPVFVVQRRSDPARAYEVCKLPAQDRDPMELSVRPLRPLDDRAPDSRITWPAPGGFGKDTLDVHAEARAARQYETPLAMSAVKGGLRTKLLMGDAFALDEARREERTHTVWLQEWEQVAYSRMPDQRDDAGAWLRDASAPARPQVPSTREISRSLLRLDPTLAAGRMIQSWLPAASGSIDFASRAGAFVAMGVRALRSVNSVHRRFEPAEAGPSTARTIRRPRPVALPPNLPPEKGWRRTVGWYGVADRTCIAFAGAWDSIAGPLKGDAEIPPWCVFIGKPVPFGLVEESRGSPPVWRGSVIVQCVVHDKEGKPAAKPAHVFLCMLAKAQEKNPIRCSLRIGTRNVGFSSVDLLKEEDKLSADRLVFSLMSAEKISQGNCTFELSFVPPDDPLDEAEEAVNFEKLVPPETLELAALRAVVLPVFGPVQDRYPVPLMRRTVFFADPEFDRRVSRVNPLSVTDLLRTEDPQKKEFNAWIDRPAVTPAETAVVRVKSNDDTVGSYALGAKVVRCKGGAPVELLFQLEAGSLPFASVVLQSRKFYSLPVAVLRDREGRFCAPGDTLVLELSPMGLSDRPPARLEIPVKSRSTLPPPQAMYSLITTDSSRPAAWCTAHSPMPSPEGLWTEVLDEGSDKLARRATFKWTSFDAASDHPLAYSILKGEKATESTHIPEVLELEANLAHLRSDSGLLLG